MKANKERQEGSQLEAYVVDKSEKRVDSSVQFIEEETGKILI